MPGFEPQTAVQFITVPIGDHFNATPTAVEATLLSVPDNANFQVELLGISLRQHIVVVDAGTTTLDIEWIDDSDSDAVANLLAAFEYTGTTALVSGEVWRGSQILDPGDAVNAEITSDGGLTTAGEGPAFTVEFRIKRHS